MSLSRLALDFYTRCWRCNQGISSDSFFAVKLWPEFECIRYDIVMAKELCRDDLAVHICGDRECTKEVSGYHGKILKRLDLSISCDTSFLDTV